MKKRTEGSTRDDKIWGARCVSDADLQRIRGGAGNAAIDFSVKPAGG